MRGRCLDGGDRQQRSLRACGLNRLLYARHRSLDCTSTSMPALAAAPAQSDGLKPTHCGHRANKSAGPLWGGCRHPLHVARHLLQDTKPSSAHPTERSPQGLLLRAKQLSSMTFRRSMEPIAWEILDVDSNHVSRAAPAFLRGPVSQQHHVEFLRPEKRRQIQWLTACASCTRLRPSSLAWYIA